MESRKRSHGLEAEPVELTGALGNGMGFVFDDVENALPALELLFLFWQCFLGYFLQEMNLLVFL